MQFAWVEPWPQVREEVKDPRNSLRGLLPKTLILEGILCRVLKMPAKGAEHQSRSILQNQQLQGLAPYQI